MRKKLKASFGVSTLLALLVLLAVVLAFLIAVPMLRSASDQKLARIDAEYQAAAERTARDQIMVKDGGVLLVYDSVRKCFVKPEQLEEVSGYAMSKEHQGEYLVAVYTKAGDWEVQWMAEQDIKKEGTVPGSK